MRATGDYRNYEVGRGWVTCSDALCGGTLERPIYGHYDKDRNVIELFKPAFTSGGHAFATSQTETRGAMLARVEIAVATLGHEAAHSMGIDMNGSIAPVHYEAERAGMEALANFRALHRLSH